ncbi:MAG: NADH-quinone oxidoreductase subunit A [Planctomycetes bacterium]|nr:NADH-quinone oxidoreductase subunit A [Planctomycetota bacterium]
MLSFRALVRENSHEVWCGVSPYLSLLIYGALVIVTCAVLLGLSTLLGPRRGGRPVKVETYECGVPVLAPSRGAVHVKFYLVAILFVLFDVETVFLLPWAVSYRRMGAAGVAEMMVFLAVLGLGLAWAWRKGVLDWNR